MGIETTTLLAAVGPRIRSARLERDITLAELALTTDISVSTLSRLESGQRRANLELLLPIAKALRVSIEDLISPPPTVDPRVHVHPVSRHGMTIFPLSRREGGIQAFKMVIPANMHKVKPNPQVHEGYEWIYVLKGRLRLILASQDIVLETGEAAEFDTREPHWTGSAGPAAVEYLALFGKNGERMHVRIGPSKNK